MHETTLPFAAWEGFYVIVGTSAGALTGLQFVVLTLISESGRIRGTSATLSAFATPNVVHFCAALLLSAVMTVPWRDPGPTGVVLVLSGFAGLLYALTVLGRARRQRDYKPVLEDWVWHITLPIVAYAAVILGGIGLSRAPLAAFAVGGATLLLVFVGIHNAWDTVTYVMADRARESESKAAGRDARSVSSTANSAADAPDRRATPADDPHTGAG